MDMLCFAVGLRFLGKTFAKYSLVASCGFAFSYSIFEKFPPLLPDFTAYPIVAAILGGLFVGVGVGICVRIGGAAGGDDALALVISNLGKVKISKAYFATDLIVLVLSLSYIPMTKIAYSLITVTISSYVIDLFQSFRSEEKDSDNNAFVLVE